MKMKESNVMVHKMFGTTSLSGVFQNMPAVLLSYDGGATLWVFKNGDWVIQEKTNNYIKLYNELVTEDV